MELETPRELDGVFIAGSQDAPFFLAAMVIRSNYAL